MLLKSTLVQIVNSVDISGLPDDVLWQKAAFLATEERAATVELIEHLAEIDDRKLWEKKEFTSMFEFCMFGLRFSEGNAYRHIRAARAIRLFPPLLPPLRDGRLSVKAVVMLHPHLETEDAAQLVRKAMGLRIKQLEALLSGRLPQDARREVVRFVGSAPAAKPAPEAAPPEGLPFDAVVDTVSQMFVGADNPPPPPPTVIAPPVPPSPRLVRFAFTADEEFYRLLQRVRALMRHKYPDGRLEGVLREALRALLERKDPLIRWEAIRKRREKKSRA